MSYLIRKLTPGSRSRATIPNTSTSPTKLYKKQPPKRFKVKTKTQDESPESIKRKSKIKLQTLVEIMTIKSSILGQLSLTSSSWCLYDQERENFIGFRENNQRQIASLTKIMTTILCIQFFNSVQMREDFYVKVTQNASRMIGTSAELKANTWVKAWDLLYGAMLPSGNDSAFLLSQVVGYLSKKYPWEISQIKNLDLSFESTTLYTTSFVRMMNKKAQQLRLNDTTFSNPHGLQNAMNTSSPKDILRLSIYASKNPTFKKIMNTDTIRYYYLQEHKEIPLNTKSDQIIARFCKKQRNRWWNTNALLNKGWQGIKTGQTGSAGSCLASLKKGIYIVVLNCKDNEARFTETEKIYEWYINRKNSRQSTQSGDSQIF